MDALHIFIALIESFLGKPYRWGGDDPMEGFDCSGLVNELLQSVGVLPHKSDFTAQMLYDKFRTGDNICKLGHLLFFGKSMKEVTHVTMALCETLMIEAGGGGSSTISLDAAVKQNAFVRVRPIWIRTDLVGYGRPNYPWEEK
jgi:peptidoglycan DL-endopeptidase CwlO